MRHLLSLLVFSLCVGVAAGQVKQAPPVRPEQAPPLKPAQVRTPPHVNVNVNVGCDCALTGVCTCGKDCQCPACRVQTGDPAVIHRDPQTGRRWHYTPDGPHNWDWLPEPVTFRTAPMFQPMPSMAAPVMRGGSC